MGTLVLYQKDNVAMHKALLEFVENSEACVIGMVKPEHLDQIYLAYVYMEGKIVAGLCALFKNKYVSSELLLVVREGYQGRGIANEIHEKLLADARNNKLPIALTTYDTDTYQHVIKFYEKFNFIRLAKFNERLLYGLKSNSRLFTFRRISIFYCLAFFKECKALIKEINK